MQTRWQDVGEVVISKHGGDMLVKAWLVPIWISNAKQTMTKKKCTRKNKIDGKGRENEKKEKRGKTKM